MGIVELQLHGNSIYFLSMVVLDLDVQIDVPGIGGVLFIWVVIGRQYPPLASIVQQEDPQWLGYSDNPPSYLLKK